jgi:hypothetical protein
VTGQQLANVISRNDLYDKIISLICSYDLQTNAVFPVSLIYFNLKTYTKSQELPPPQMNSPLET